MVIEDQSLRYDATVRNVIDVCNQLQERARVLAEEREGSVIGPLECRWLPVAGRWWIGVTVTSPVE